MSVGVTPDRKALTQKFLRHSWVRWGFISLTVILLMPFFLFLFVRIYKPEIIEVMNREISDRYKAVIHFDDVDITLFKTFPRTSLVLKNFSVKNPAVSDSVLITSEKIYLTLDIISLFKKEIVFDGIQLDKAQMNFTQYQSGMKNWDILTSQSTSSTVVIEDIIFDDCQLQYNNRSTQWISHFNIEKAEIKGDISRPESSFDMDVYFEIDSLMSQGNSYKIPVPIRVTAQDAVRNGEELHCNSIRCRSGKVDWKINADLNLEQQGQSHVMMETHDAQLDELIMILPRKYVNDLNDYSLDGESDLKLELHLGQRKKSLSGSFHVRDGICNYKELGELNDIFAEIEFGTEDGGYCEIKNCKAATSGGKLDIMGRLNFVESGYFGGSLQYEGPLDELAAMSPMGETFKVDGEASIQAKLEGILFDPQAKLKPELQEGSGWIRLKDASAFIPGLKTNAEQIQLEADVTADEVKIKSMDFLLYGSHFQVSGNLVNLLGAIAHNGSLQMTGLVIQSDQLDIKDWNLQNQSQGSEEKSEHQTADIDYVLEGQFKCSNVIREGLNLKDFTCSFNSTSARIQLEKISAGIANGRIAGMYTQRTNDFEGRFSFENIDMHQLFQQTNNFGQTKITSQNLSGLLTGTAKVNAALGKDGSIDTKTLWLESDITIRNGRLRNYTPLIQLVDFIEENRMLSVFANEDQLRIKLSDVEFSDLRNVLYVQEGQVIIPKMKVESSAFDITAEGRQSFDGMIDYNIGFNIFEVLRNREAAPGKTRNNIFIHMFGTTDKPQFEVEKEFIQLPEIKLPSFLRERNEMENNAISNDAVIESDEVDTTKSNKRKLPSIIKNKEGETRKWLREKN